jgi:hypothetical protein
MGQRLLAPFAEKMDRAEEEFVRMAEEFSVLKPNLGLGAVYTSVLSEEDAVRYTVGLGGTKIYTYPTTVSGEHPTLGTIALERVDTFEEVMWGVPDRFEAGAVSSYTNNLVWSSTAPVTYTAIDVPERLTIVISGSTKYDKKTQRKDRFHSGEYLVRIVGVDKGYREVTEVVRIRDDGIYNTRNIFIEVTRVDYEGFDGQVDIYIAPIALSYEGDPYHVAVGDEVEGPLKLSVSGVASTELKYFTDRLKSGREYRTGTEEAPVDNEVEVITQVLRDSVGADYVPVDLTINPDTARLYVLDDTGKVHIYNHGIKPFAPPTLNSEITKEARITVQTLCPYVPLGSSHPNWAFHRVPQDRIKDVSIKRVDPAGTTEYLQSDKVTWAAGVHRFPGNQNQVLPEDTWTTFKFDTTYNQTGQWEYYTSAKTVSGKEYVAYTAVMVDAMNAESTIDSSVASPTGIFYAENGELVVTTATDFNYFTEHKDAVFIEPQTSQMVLRENYDSVTVSY